MKLKDRLKKNREVANYTQKELAEILNVSRQTVSSWEVGRTYPDLDMIVVLSDLYAIPLDMLLKEDSKLVDDITAKVHKSQHRKILNYILSIALILFIGVGISTIIRHQKNNVVNEEGLRAAFLINSTWQLHLDPSKEIESSFISFGKNSVVTLNKFSVMILPFTDPEELKKKTVELEDKGLESGLSEFELLTVETKGNKYIVSALGYYQEFTKLSDTLIRDMNGTEYKLLEQDESHSALKKIAEDTEL